MLAYAVRFEVDEILLFYPNTYNQQQEKHTELIIKDTLANNKEILIKAIQLPIINRELLSSKHDSNTKLEDMFSVTKSDLISRIKIAFGIC